MDDPWGSPWADELHHSIPHPDSKGHGLTLAHTTTQRTTADTIQKTDGPWGGHGGHFGDWAEDSVLQDATESDGVSGANPAWEPQGTEEIKADGGGLSPQWDRSQAGSGHSTPKLSPTLLPKPVDVSRQPSPDPWVTAAVPLDEDYQKHIPRRWGQHTEASSGSTILSGPPHGTAAEQDENSLAEVKDSAPRKSADDRVIVEDTLDSSREDPQTPILRDYLTGEEVDGVSRSSSSPSDHSQHDEIHPESPRTSVEDETNRPEVQRHVSEKIQVLVEHFDGLAKAQLEDPAISGKSHDSNGDGNNAGPHDEGVARFETRPQSVADLDQEDDDDDFGDFEDGQSQIDETPGQDEHTSKDQPSRSPDDESCEDPKELMLPTMVPSRHTQTRDFGRAEYTVDTAALGALYPELKSELPKDPANKLFIPDAIPHDSFSSVEERKMWYRLSRYTTLRQHNSGDDDNYVRVTWAQSKIREETLKIAAKWMEQDRISGRVVLGGDSKDGTLFGWNDPKAAPVPLTTAFAEKKGKKKPHTAGMTETAPEAPREWPTGLVKARPSSKTRSPSQRRRRSSTKGSKPFEATKSVPLPVASFTWNSESQPIPPLPKPDPKPVPFQLSGLSSQKPAPSTELQPASSILAPIAPTQQNPNGLNPPTLSITTTQSPSLNFNDDWGDMVSSPVVAAPSRMQPSHGLRHQKSQSLIGLSPAQLPSTDTTHPPRPFGNGHRPTASLDEILIPMKATHASPPPLSNPFNANTSTSNSIYPATSNTAPSANSNYDPWASADFSFFESAPPPPQTLKSAPPSHRSAAHTIRPATKAVPFQSTRAEPPWRDNGRTKYEAEQDRIVASILKRLPDLSYMSRR